MGGSAGREAREWRRVGAAALALLALAGPGLAVAGDVPRVLEPWVRVLLYRGEDSVEIADERVEAGSRGLRRDGHPAGRVLTREGPAAVQGQRYRGRIRAALTGDELVVVNELPLEEYLEGTLLREVPVAWEPAALRAQAVVARTYALYRMRGARHPDYDLTAGVESQVYGGMEAEHPKARAAVEDTRGQVLLYAGEPILAVYHSTSGGRTASAEEVWGRPVPYLVSLDVEEEEAEAPHTYWRIPVSAATLGQALADLGLPIGPVRGLEVLERSASGRVQQVRVRGNRGARELDGRALRQAVGSLPSTLFEVRAADEGFVLVGSGHGHGVGMSQWGARAMARRGASHREILERFYPGARLVGRWGAGEGQ